MNISFGHFSLRNDDFEHFFIFAYECDSIEAAALLCVYQFGCLDGRVERIMMMVMVVRLVKEVSFVK